MASSMTGLASSRAQSSLTTRRASPSSGASTCKRNALPARILTDTGEAERRQGALDRRSLGVGNARSQLYLDEHFEIGHRDSPARQPSVPGQSAKLSPLTRS